jgi:hypothetical protein
VPTSGSYIILPGTSGAGETGAYTLDVSSSTTAPLEADVSAARPQPLRFGPVRLPKNWGPSKGISSN